MTKIYSCKAKAIATGGTALTHGLTKLGVATAPDGWCFNNRLAPGAAAAGKLFLTTSPTATTITVSTSGATGQVDIYCWLDHSIIK